MTKIIDEIAPKLIASIPKTGGVSVKANQNLVLTFNESVKAGTGNIVISDGKDVRKIAITDNSQVSISGKKIIINPTDDLLSGRHYSVTIASLAIKDLAGNNYAGINNKTTLSFDTLDTQAPVLVSSTPKASSVGVKVNQNLVLTFNEAVKIGTGNIVISDGKDIHKIAITDKSQVTISGKKITINPTDDLLSNGHYSVTIAPSAIKDLAGNNYAGINNKTTLLHFDTIADKQAPLLVSSIPSVNTTAVNINQNLVFTFNEVVKAGKGNVVISNGTDVRTISISDTSQITISNNVVTINPKTDLQMNSHYTVQFAAGVITDKIGNAFAGLNKTTSLNFTTQDLAPPKLVSVTPVDNNMNVAKNNDLVLTFDEVVRAGTGNFIITNSADNTDTRTISIADKTQVSINGKTVTINPTADFKDNGSYSLQFGSNVIQDLFGNSFAGITDATTFNFNVTPNKLIEGKVSDGYLKGATVTITDANGKVYTTQSDDQGSFKFPLGTPTGVITATGGIDLLTGKEFKGILKAPEGSTMVTPLTTLQQSFIESGQSVDKAEQTVATAFSFDATKLDLKTYDPIIALLNTEVAGSMLTDKAFAAKMVAVNAQIANFLVASSSELQGAAGGVDKLSTQLAENSLLNSLVAVIQNDVKIDDGVIDLANSALLKTVLIQSAAQAADTSTGESANFLIRIGKLSTNFATIMKDAADNVTTAVNTGGNAAILLTNIGKVSAFTQGDIGEAFQKMAASGALEIDSIAKQSLDSQLKLFTGGAADVSIANKTVSPLSGATSTDAVVSKIIADAIAATTISDANTAKAASDAAAAAKIAADAAAAKALADAQAAKIASDAAAAKLAADALAAANAKAIEDAAAAKALADAQAAANANVTDNTAPTLSLNSPADNATAVAINSNIVLTFSETVKAGIGDIVMTNTNGSDTRTISISDSQISISGNTVTLNPTIDLKEGYDYNVTLASGVIKDLAGNNFVGISSATAFNFTTIAPTGTVNVETSGNDVINAIQGSVYSNPLNFHAENGNDQYVINTLVSNGAISGANISISGFSTGDKLVFDVAGITSSTAASASLIAGVDALYSVSDDGGSVTLLANNGDVQQIALTGLSGSRSAAGVGNSIDSIAELSTFLGTGSISFI